MRAIPASRAALPCLLLLASAAGAAASDNLADPYVRVGIAAWYATPDITIDQDSGGEVKGSDVGLDGGKVGGMIDAYVDVPVPLVPGIHAGAWQWRHGIDGGDDVTVTGGYAVAMWEIELLDRVGVALGAGVIGQELAQDEESDSTLMPAVAGRAWVRLTDGFTAELHLIGGGRKDDRGGDALAQVTWRFIGPVAAIGGWRQTWSTQELETSTWKVSLGGPFLGLAVVL